jgi:hypothetical protein
MPVENEYQSSDQEVIHPQGNRDQTHGKGLLDNIFVEVSALSSYQFVKKDHNPRNSNTSNSELNGNQRIAIPVDNTEENNAYNEALSALAKILNKNTVTTPSDEIGRLAESLTGHVHETDSLILGSLSMRGAAIDLGGSNKFLQTTTFVSERSKKSELGQRFNSGKSAGMLVTASPFGNDDDRLKVTLGYLKGTDMSSSPDAPQTKDYRGARALSAEPLDGENFSLYNKQWSNEVVSAALESYLADDRLWFRGETASSNYDSDVADSRNNGVSDRAHSLLADFILFRSTIGKNRFNWSVGLEDQNAGQWFRSPGNNSNLDSWRTRNAYSTMTVGNLNFSASAGVDTENVGSEVRPAERDRWNSFSTRYQIKTESRWLGKPDLRYSFGTVNSSETEVPVSYNDALYSAETESHNLAAYMKYPWGYWKVGYGQSSIDDQTGIYSDRELTRTSLGASYQVYKGLNLFGRLNHNHEKDLTVDDAAREWRGSLGFRLTGQKSSLWLQYGQSDFNALTGFDDRESNTLSTRYSWAMNPETRFWLRGNYRNSSNNNDSVLLLLGVELGARSQFQ